MNIKEVLVEKLKKDCEVVLNQKLKNALENNDDGRYRNLVKILETNLNLIDKYDFDADVETTSVNLDYKGNCIIRIHITKPNITRENLEEIFNGILKLLLPPEEKINVNDSDT